MTNVAGGYLRVCHDSALPTSTTPITLLVGAPQEVAAALQNPNKLVGSKHLLTHVFSKTSPQVKSSYLFVDLDSKNAANVLAMASAGKFPYVLIYQSVWAQSAGTYAINAKNFPGGINGLKGVAKLAKKHGITIGLHTLTSLVSTTDPLVSDTSTNHELVESAKASLTNAIRPTTTTFIASMWRPSNSSPTMDAPIKNGSVAILVDSEVMACDLTNRNSQLIFDQCQRGTGRTRKTSHSKGAEISLLVKRYGMYVANLSEPIKDTIAQHIADALNDSDAGMVYFDGAEAASANGDPKYYNAEMPIAVIQKLKRTTLVQASSFVSRSWPYVTRMASGDTTSLDPIDSTDKYKISVTFPSYQANLMPAELGWIGLFSQTPASPDTTIEEASTYMARSLALNAAFSIETHYADLVSNPYTTRLLKVFSAANHILLTGTLSTDARRRLLKGWWYFVDSGSQASPALASLTTYKTDHVNEGTHAVMLGRIPGKSSGLMLRISNISKVKKPPGANAIDLMPLHDRALQITEVATTDANRGQLVETLPVASLMVSQNAETATNQTPYIGPDSKHAAVDLTRARQMYVEYDAPSAVGTCLPILNLQLQDKTGSMRDYLLDVQPGMNHTAVLRYEDAPRRVLATLAPSARAYSINKALRGFDFSSVEALNVRWMKSCDLNKIAPIKITKLEMLKESNATLHNVTVSVGSTDIASVPELETGETFDIFPDQTATLCRKSKCRSVAVRKISAASLNESPIKVSTDGSAGYDLTFGTLGTRIPMKLK